MKISKGTKQQREAWLIRAMRRITRAWRKLGIVVPADVQLSCGFPSGGGHIPCALYGAWGKAIGAPGEAGCFVRPDTRCLPRAQRKNACPPFTSWTLDNNLKLIDLDQHERESGYWKVSEQTAQCLVDGDLDIHDGQLASSRFGGIILGYRMQQGGEFDGRMIFRFRASLVHKGVRTDRDGWGGEKKLLGCDLEATSKHAMAGATERVAELAMVHAVAHAAENAVKRAMERAEEDS